MTRVASPPIPHSQHPVDLLDVLVASALDPLRLPPATTPASMRAVTAAAQLPTPVLVASLGTLRSLSLSAALFDARQQGGGGSGSGRTSAGDPPAGPRHGPDTDSARRAALRASAAAATASAVGCVAEDLLCTVSVRALIRAASSGALSLPALQVRGATPALCMC